MFKHSFSCWLIFFLAGQVNRGTDSPTVSRLNNPRKGIGVPYSEHVHDRSPTYAGTNFALGTKRALCSRYDSPRESACMRVDLPVQWSAALSKALRITVRHRLHRCPLSRCVEGKMPFPSAPGNQRMPSRSSRSVSRRLIPLVLFSASPSPSPSTAGYLYAMLRLRVVS